MVRAIERRLGAESVHLDRSRESLEATLGRSLERRRAVLAKLGHRVALRHPRAVLGSARARVAELEGRARRALTSTLANDRRELVRHAARLDAMSPLAVLARGYAIATRSDGAIVRSIHDARAGEALAIRVADGRIETRVESFAESGGKPTDLVSARPEDD